MKRLIPLLALLGTLFGHGAAQAADAAEATATTGTTGTTGKAPIALVVTNHGELGETGKPTGFYLSEAAHPYEVFREAGHPVVLASPAGGFAPVDPKSLELDDAANAAFWKEFGGEPDGRKGVAGTTAIRELDPAGLAGVFFAGGHGTMWDFASADPVGEFITAVDRAEGVIGAVCHGPAALVGAKAADGEPLVKGCTVAVFTNAEEQAVELTEVVPFLLETRLAKLGAEVRTAANFSENAVRDGRLVTGQNPASARRAGELFLEALEEE